MEQNAGMHRRVLTLFICQIQPPSETGINLEIEHDTQTFCIGSKVPMDKLIQEGVDHLSDLDVYVSSLVALIQRKVDIEL